MDEACLVTGKPGPLLVELVQQAAGRNRRVLVTRSGRMDPGPPHDAVSSISWNRRSALSARSVVLHATNLFTRLDESIVVFSPALDKTAFHESSVVSIEDRVDAEVKGYLFILREIFGQMVRQAGGRVALVVQQPLDELESPLEATGAASFTALAAALDRHYQNEPVLVHRFRTTEDDPASFASFILDRLDADRDASPRLRRTRGKWLRFPPGSLFRSLRLR